ncbi:MAG TPA: cell division protein ZapA [Sphingobium sp.]|nr:cell division protein ZapA [Sphingobium sp.]
MAEVKIMVGGRQYTVSCRDGDEDRLRHLAGVMSDKVTQVKAGTQNLTEVRQLLFAGLLLADALSEKAAPVPKAATPPPPVDESETLTALSRLAERIEALGDSLAAQLPNA